jgi:hypothetical protein
MVREGDPASSSIVVHWRDRSASRLSLAPAEALGWAQALPPAGLRDRGPTGERPTRVASMTGVGNERGVTKDPEDTRQRSS